MDVLATRVLSYPDENGDERYLVLTVFVPVKTPREDWECEFDFGPPVHQKMVPIAGVDFIQAFICSLTIASAYLQSTKLFGRAHWQGMLDCGLPDIAAKPATWAPPDLLPPGGDPGDMDVLATRAVRYPDESGAEREILLTVFVPFEAEDKTWKCGCTFGPPLDASLRYGVGADFIEALLDCLAMARAAFEEKAPKGRGRSDEAYDLSDLPYKIGRSFRTEPAPPVPGMPDFSSSSPLVPPEPQR